MARRHVSFLLRCWDLGGASERIEIVHVQSGVRTVVGSLDAAIVWLRVDASDRLALDGPVAPDVSGGPIPNTCPTET